MIGKNIKSTFPSGGSIGFAFKNFVRISGSQRAAAFAYYAFFSLFPLLLFSATMVSFFVKGDIAAHDIVHFFARYAPLDEGMNLEMIKTITGMAGARNGTTILVPLVFFWGAYRFFDVLIQAVNRAWQTERKNWWSLTGRSSLLVGITGLSLLLGLALPMTVRLARDWAFATYNFVAWIYDGVIVIGPLLVLFLGLSVLYRLAPYRETRFSEVWSSALAAALMLCLLEIFFGIYLRSFSELNLVYGAFGGMMALLLWIYLSGVVVILGACLAAGQTQVRARWWRNLW